MFNAPMSLQRAQYLISALDISPNDRVLDIGCGDGLFLKHIALSNQIIGIGVDNDEALIDAAITDWSQPESAITVGFVCEDALSYSQKQKPVDIAISIGSEFVFGGYRELLQVAHKILKPNGKLLVGTIYWKQTPPPDYLVLMNGENAYFDLSTTVELAHDAGYLPLEVHRSNDDEWDIFESRHTRKRYMSAIQTEQSELQDRAWSWQSGYLKWGMVTMGFCFLILQKIDNVSSHNEDSA